MSELAIELGPPRLLRVGDEVFLAQFLLGLLRDALECGRRIGEEQGVEVVGRRRRGGRRRRQLLADGLELAAQRGELRFLGRGIRFERIGHRVFDEEGFPADCHFSHGGTCRLNRGRGRRLVAVGQFLDDRIEVIAFDGDLARHAQSALLVPSGGLPVGLPIDLPVLHDGDMRACS